MITGDYETAFRFGELGVRLAERPADRPHAGATHSIHALFLSHLKRHISVSLEHVRIALQLSLDAGDLVQANYCLGLGTPYRLYAGEALDSIRRDLPDMQQAVRRADDVINGGFLTIMERAILALEGETSNLSRLDGPGFSEARFEAAALPPVRAFYGPMKAMVRFMGEGLRGDPAGDGGVQAAARLVLQRLASLLSRPGARGGEPLRRPVMSGVVASSASTTTGVTSRSFAEHCPANHGHRDKLLRAELAALEGDVIRAVPPSTTQPWRRRGSMGFCTSRRSRTSWPRTPCEPVASAPPPSST